MNLQQHRCEDLNSRTLALLGKHLMLKVVTLSLTHEEIDCNSLSNTMSLMPVIFEVILMVLSIKMWSSGVLHCVIWWLGATILEEPHLRAEE
jgi:hypothetical protein